jgi:acyl-CoA thioester hydrolase
MFFSDLGTAVASPEFAWMTVRLEISYLQQLSLPGTVEVATGVLEIGRSSVRLSHAIFSSDTCAAQGECVMVLVDRLDNRATPIPAEMRTALSAMSCKK